MRDMLFIMESSLVTCETFAATAFSTGTSGALWAYVKDMWRTPKSSTSMLANLALMALTSLYPIFFPTIVSAMTGYQTTTTAFVSAADGTLFQASSLSPVPYVVWDCRPIRICSKPERNP